MIWFAAGLALAATPEEAFRAMRAAEASHDYAEAVAQCRRVLSDDPAGPRTTTCARRVAFLEARRDEDGGFGAFATLQRVREAFREGDRPGRHATVTALLDDGNVAPTTRAEALVWLAADLVDEDAAVALQHANAVSTLALIREVDPVIVTQAQQIEALALAKLGRADEALAAEARVRVPVAAEAARPTPVQSVLTTARQRRWATVAGATVALFAVFTVPMAAWAVSTARMVPLGLGPLGIAIGGSGLVAVAWDRSLGALFAVWALGLVAVHLLSAGALRRAKPSRPAVLLIRIGSAAATLAVSYLAWWWAGALGHLGL